MAIAGDHPWRILPVAELGPALVELTRATVELPEDPPIQDGADAVGRSRHRPSGSPSVFKCPECHGPLWEVEEGALSRYRCRVGHAFSAESLATEQASAVDAALWSALEALHERAEFQRKLAHRARELGGTRSRAHYTMAAEDAERRAEMLRSILVEAPSTLAGGETG
jgi:two-component system chemotaxis response regulator CheB